MTGAYSAQKEDLNISLTAIGLLWTSSDFIARGLTEENVIDMGTGIHSLFNFYVSSYIMLYDKYFSSL